jgi:hypothetical protein
LSCHTCVAFKMGAKIAQIVHTARLSPKYCGLL